MDLTYLDLEDRNVIETFAVDKQVNGELGFEIKDYNLTEEQKNCFKKPQIYILNLLKLMIYI